MSVAISGKQSPREVLNEIGAQLAQASNSPVHGITHMAMLNVNDLVECFVYPDAAITLGSNNLGFPFYFQAMFVSK